MLFYLAGYSGSDMAYLCKEAALGPIRTLAFDDIENLSADQVEHIHPNSQIPISFSSRFAQ
jgi:hypothetical protein